MSGPTPFTVLTRKEPERIVPRRSLVSLSRQIESLALALNRGELWVCMQRAEHYSPITQAIHNRLARSGVGVNVFGVDVTTLQATMPAVRMHDVSPAATVAREWNVLLVSGLDSMALSARPVTTSREAGRPGQSRSQEFRALVSLDPYAVREASAALHHIALL